ncbi:MAG: PIN domain-containing protein [Nitrospirales bacterium]
MGFLLLPPKSPIDEGLAEGRVFLSPLVAAELSSAKRPARHRAELESFLEELSLCVTDVHHWFLVGLLRSRLQLVGLSISTPDAHVAQCALDLEADLLTEDTIFFKGSKNIGLKVVN